MSKTVNMDLTLFGFAFSRSTTWSKIEEKTTSDKSVFENTEASCSM